MENNITKPISVLAEQSINYFKDNPNSTEFQLQKAVLGSRLGVGINKQGRICMALIGEYPFLKDGKGFLTIEKQSFEDWLKLKEELEKERELNINQGRENQALAKEIQNWKETNESNEKTLAEGRAFRDKLKARSEELTKEEENLPKETKELNEKLIKIRAETEEMKREGSDLNIEFSKAQNERNKIEVENSQKIANIQTYRKTSEKKKNMTALELLNENNAKMRAELSEIKSHPLYDDYRHEKSKQRKIAIGFLWFLGFRAIEWLIIRI